MVENAEFFLPPASRFLPLNPSTRLGFSNERAPRSPSSGATHRVAHSSQSSAKKLAVVGHATGDDKVVRRALDGAHARANERLLDDERRGHPGASQLPRPQRRAHVASGAADLEHVVAEGGIRQNVHRAGSVANRGAGRRVSTGHFLS